MKGTPLFGHSNNGGSFLLWQNLQENKKIELYKKRKDGQAISSLSKEYQMAVQNIKYLIRVIDKHGFDILNSEKKRGLKSK